MRNGIPGVLIEGYSASVSLLVAVGTCCGAGAAQVPTNIALGHLSPMLFNNKATKTNQQDPFWVDPGVPTLPEAEQLIASLMMPATGHYFGFRYFNEKNNKENAIDDKQLRNTGLSNNYTAYGAGKRQLHTETPWEKKLNSLVAVQMGRTHSEKISKLMLMLPDEPATLCGCRT
ncbi:hypothetical protein ACLKA6_010055 [Drosophila palustris]